MAKREKDIKIVVGVALERKLGSNVKAEYEKTLEVAGCTSQADVRLVTSTFFSNALFKARSRSEGQVHDLLPLLNHAVTTNRWLNNIKTKIIPRISS